MLGVMSQGKPTLTNVGTPLMLKHVCPTGAEIIPILKNGEDKDQENSCRPISLPIAKLLAERKAPRTLTRDVVGFPLHPVDRRRQPPPRYCDI